MKIYLPKSK